MYGVLGKLHLQPQHTSPHPCMCNTVSDAMCSATHASQPQTDNSFDHKHTLHRFAQHADADADAASGAAVAGAATVYLSGKSTEVAAAAKDTAKEAKEDLQQLVNWSGTHHVRPERFYQPETTEEVEDIVRNSHEQGRACLLATRAILLC